MTPSKIKMAKAPAVISQKDYLQKYLTGKNVDKKKKKRKIAKIAKEKRSVIVDDDEIKGMRELADGELDLFSMSEDAPQIAGIIDERPDELKTIETFRSSARWKVISDEHGIEDIQVVAIPGQPKSPGDSDDDLSPARNKRDDSDESPPRRQNKDDFEDLPRKPKDDSPWGRRRSRSTSPPSTQRRKDGNDSRHSRPGRDSGTDVRVQARIKTEPESPVRKDKTRKSQETFVDSDESPPRRNDRQARGSPARVNRRDRDYNSSKSRKERRRDDSDESPPRRSKKGDSDESPPRRKSRKGRDSSEEAARRMKHSGVSRRDRDQPSSRSSKKERRRDDSDESPPRKSKRGNSVESPPRKHKKNADRDLTDRSRSQRHRGRESNDNLRRKSRKDDSDSDNSPPRKAKKTSRENDDGARRPRRGSSDRADAVGRVAVKVEKGLTKGPETEVPDSEIAPIYRDRKTGRKRDLAAEAQQRKEDEAKTDVAKAKYTRWGAGLAQMAERETRVQDALREAAKPVARFADDADLDAMLRARDREGDPMLEYIKAKSHDVSVPSKPRYVGSFPPNRYGIAPGHRWDGVDRSTGFERRWFEGSAARQAVAEDAYKWSVADM